MAVLTFRLLILHVILVFSLLKVLPVQGRAIKYAKYVSDELEFEETVEDDEDEVEEDEENDDDEDWGGWWGIDASCVDRRDECREWAAAGDCATNPTFVHAVCPEACNVCHNRTRTVPATRAFAPRLPVTEQETENIVSVIGGDLGVPQPLEGKKSMQRKLKERIQQARDYMKNKVLVEDRYKNVRSTCRNEDGECASLAIQGDCEEYPDWMHIHCAPVCFSCHELDPEARCPLDPSVQNALYRGDLDRLMERIATDESLPYDRTILLHPSLEGDAPWVIVLDNFLKPDECQTLIEMGEDLGFEPTSKIYPDGTLEEIMSIELWCDDDGCLNHPVILEVEERIENLTNISRSNSEVFQLSKYEQGQYYEKQHDYIEGEVRLINGVRILTVLLFLNDVQKGGDINFPELDLTVQPKRGRALIWPTVLNDRPNDKDVRTSHRALPVKKGVKYTMSTWIHQRDYWAPTEAGCFDF